MLWLVVDQWHHVAAIDWALSPGLFSIALLAIVALFFLDAYGWHLILKAMGQNLPAHQSIRIWILSSVTRYLPGGIWPYVSRASLAKEQGMAIPASSISLYIETLLLVTSSLAVGFPALLSAVDVPVSPVSALLIMIAFGLLMHPKIILLLRFIPGRIGKAIVSIQLPSLTHLAGLYIYYVVFWVLFGIVFVCFASAVYPIPYQNWIHVGSAIAFAFFSGFVIVFFPGGIGIREAILYVLLITSLPHPACLLISVGSRLWVMLGEGFSICLVLIWQRHNSKASYRF